MFKVQFRRELNRFWKYLNPETKYVVLGLFDEKGAEMENIRKTLDEAGFYDNDIKIQSSWPIGTYSATIMPSEFDSVVYFNVLGTDETWDETNKTIQNFP